MAFVLTLTDNVETVDFVGDTYRVANGGFDISTPQKKRELVPQRPGFYVPSIEYYEYRESKIEFEIRGATRAAVLSNIQKVERILRNISLRVRLNSGSRGQLSYKWDGATNTTFFEVYGGDFAYPRDVLSIEKMHMVLDQEYIVTDCTLTLYLSAYGYGLSIYSDPTTELALYNPSVGAKQTGGVAVTNPGNDTGKYNYVEIEDTDVPGSQPYILKLAMVTDTPYTEWNGLYIGHQVSPYPSLIVYDDYDKSFPVTSPTSAAGANPDATDTYETYTGANLATSEYGPSYMMGWPITNNSYGMFYAFLHLWTGMTPDYFIFSVGIYDAGKYGIKFDNDYVQPTDVLTGGHYTVPLGPIQLPPADPALKDAGTLDGDLELALWAQNISATSPATLNVDYMSLLPIGGGLRIWKTRSWESGALTGTFYDDGWKGLEYIKSGSTVWTPWYGLMEPLKLEANRDQRLYFTSFEHRGSPTDDRARQFKVRAWAIPTYFSLAT